MNTKADGKADKVLNALLRAGKFLAPRIVQAARQVTDLSKKIAHVAATVVVSATESSTFKWRDWDLSFGPVYGEAGTVTVLSVVPQCLFRGEKVMATDSAMKSGYGTRITQVLIGQRLQCPATGGGTLTTFFSNGALGNGLKWDVCQPALTIAMTVSFIESCTFDAVVFGKAII